MTFTLVWRGPAVLREINSQFKTRMEQAADRVVATARQNLLNTGGYRTGRLYNSIRRTPVYESGNMLEVSIISDLEYSMIQESRKRFLRDALSSLRTI